MLTSSGSNLISSVGRSQRYYPTTEREIHPQTTPPEGKYDCVTLSPGSDENRVFKDLVGQLTQEVRTATTTGDIRTIRQQVISGEYQPDACAIAARMLFLGEDL